MTSDLVQIPIGWILGTVGILGGVISTLAITIWNTMRSRLEAQDKIIDHLRASIDRMSNGCGANGCVWHVRRPHIGDSPI